MRTNSTGRRGSSCFVLRRLWLSKASQSSGRPATATEAPIPVTVVPLGKEHEQSERAMAAAKEELGGNARRGQCLERVRASCLSRQAGGHRWVEEPAGRAGEWVDVGE